VQVNLRKRVRTAPPAEPAAGVVATLDDPRLGAVSAALARLRPQLVPDPDAPHTGDDYLAETEYAAVEAEPVATPEPLAAPGPPSIGTRWAAALSRIQSPVRRPEPEPALDDEPIPEPRLVLHPIAAPDPIAETGPVAEAEPVAESTAEVEHALEAQPATDAEPQPHPEVELAPEPVSAFSELQSVLAAVLDAESPTAEVDDAERADEGHEAAASETPVAEFDAEEPFGDEQVDEDEREAELVSVGAPEPSWAVALDGTLLPRAPLHRSRLPHRLTGAFNRPRRRRRH
jgi:hypothetical protein